MAERAARRRKPSKPYAQTKADVHTKNPTEIGVHGGLVPKKKRSAAKQHEFEKQRRANLGTNVGGLQYSSGARDYVSSTSNYNPRARTYREFLEICEAVYGGEKEEPKDTRMTVTAADKKANTPAWQKYQAGHKGYKAATHLTQEAVSQADKKLAQSGVLSRRADELQSEIDAATSGKPKPVTKSASRKVTKQSYEVKEESDAAKPAPPTPEERRKIRIMQQLERLKREKSASRMQSDVAREEYEIDENMISQRTKLAVQHQRQGTHGDDHEITNLQRSADASVQNMKKKMSAYPKGFPAVKR